MTTINTEKLDIAWVFGFAFLAAFSVMFGIYVYGNRTREMYDQTVPSALVSPTSAPSPTPLPTPKPVTITVLNGSGIPGEAARIGVLLSEISTDITVGNADSPSYTGIRMEHKTAVPDIMVRQIRTALEKEFVVIVSQSDAIPSDIRIIVGR